MCKNDVLFVIICYKDEPKYFDFEKKEETPIRDVFINNLIDPKIQKELLKQTVEPRKVLELAIILELGMRNSNQIQAHNKTLIPASVNATQNPPITFSSN